MQRRVRAQCIRATPNILNLILPAHSAATVINMNYIFDAIAKWFSFAVSQLAMIQVRDVFDILVLSVFLFLILRFAWDRRAGKLLIGMASVFAVYGISLLLGFHATSFVLGNIFEVGILAIIVLFKNEIRDALEKLGAGPLRGFRTFAESRDTAKLNESIGVLCDAVCDMSRARTGALIVVERSTKLGDLVETGVEIDAMLSAKLLKNIFYNRAPLHDGAVILRHMRIAAAGCVLPNANYSEAEALNLGTRHRAALGVSEISDAVVIVVSEETGIISIAHNGKLKRDYGASSLRHDLLIMLGGKSFVVDSSEE